MQLPKTAWTVLGSCMQLACKF